MRLTVLSLVLVFSPAILCAQSAPSAKVAEQEAPYIRESILKPQAAIVKGYEAVPMADFSAVLTNEQGETLISYLRGLE